MLAHSAVDFPQEMHARIEKEPVLLSSEGSALLFQLQTSLDVSLLQQAFKERAAAVERHIRKNLPQMVQNLIASHQNQKIRFRKRKKIFVVKVRYLEDKVQLLAQTQIGKGGFKIVKKVVVLAGPKTPSQPSPIYAYAKPRKRKRALQQLHKIEEEVQNVTDPAMQEKLHNDLVYLNNQIVAIQNDLIREARISKRLATLNNFLPMKPVFKQKDPQTIKGVMMEYCDGDLYDLIENQTYPLSQDRFDLFCAIAFQLCQAMDRMHHFKSGLCHLDLKTGNVLLKQENGTLVPKIIDFGLTKRLGSYFSGPRGTLAYIAPEQFDENIDTVLSSMDSWGLGIILLEMFYGREKNIFHDNTDVSYVHVHFHSSGYYESFFPLWKKLGRRTVRKMGTYPQIDNIIKNLLKIDPFKRWPPKRAADEFLHIAQSRS